ncbi:uncharacterized protein [Rutidosis leptorrhynchoides]|uniref:uncharacterized protein n=1 Tax=Rutidosis leptorrhynchoides TaxID=125765 RepID=UPI003A99A604
MGFNSKWIGWIRACLVSSHALLLLNGSPSSEFKIGRGLRQGDPLSLFLFIIGMVGLQAAIKDASDAMLYRGLRIGSLSFSVNFSLNMYADDVLFVGECCDINVINLIVILGCFFAISGLKINLLKSSLFGVGINQQEVIRLASMLGCDAGSFPCQFLGISVGQNMNRISSWDGILEKVKKNLSSWKANMISIRGRLTLVKSVLGSLGTYYLSSFIAPKKVIDKLESLRSNFFWGGNDHSHKMHKIKWRTVLNPHEDGGLNVARSWSNIAKCISIIHEEQLIPSHNMRICRGDGLMYNFWHDNWLGDYPLDTRFNRLFMLDTNHTSTVASRFDDVPDYWEWTADSSGIFSVSGARILIDKHYIDHSVRATIWCQLVPIKINVFTWHLNSLCLPTKINILLRGIEMESTTCCFCEQHDEDEVHIFCDCTIAMQIWDKISQWTNVQIPHWLTINDIWLWVDGIPINFWQRIILRVIITASLWNIWRLRNSFIFKDSKFKKSHVFDSIVVSAFNWLYSRLRMSCINWTVWLQDPLNAL